MKLIFLGLFCGALSFPQISVNCNPQTEQCSDLATTPGTSQTVASPKLRGGALRIYIEPQEGFESYISAAIVKKHVPAVVTADKEQADFVITSVVLAKPENTGGKIARCLFLYCIGVEGTQTATVQLINAQGDVAWAYNVHKGSASAYQSTAEAIAKHLKGFLESHPQ